MSARFHRAVVEDFFDLQVDVANCHETLLVRLSRFPAAAVLRDPGVPIVAEETCYVALLSTAMWEAALKLCGDMDVYPMHAARISFLREAMCSRRQSDLRTCLTEAP